MAHTCLAVSQHIREGGLTDPSQPHKNPRHRTLDIEPYAAHTCLAVSQHIHEGGLASPRGAHEGCQNPRPEGPTDALHPTHAQPSLSQQQAAHT